MIQKSILIALTGIFVGCGAGATLPHVWAAPDMGKWSCYQASEMADSDPLDNNRGYDQDWSDAMNAVAPSTPAGTVQSVSMGQGWPLICSKN